MTAQIIPVGTFDLVVFGGTGDLARRKLLPALYYRDLDGQLTSDSLIIGVARRKLEREAYVAQTEAALREHVAAEYLDEACLAQFLGRLRYVALDGASPAAWIELAATCDDPERIRVFYLATSPDLFGPICRGLAANHWSRRKPAWCWKSRSVTTSPRRARSTARSGRSSRRTRSSGSTTTSARRRSRI